MALSADERAALIQRTKDRKETAKTLAVAANEPPPPPADAEVFCDLFDGPNPVSDKVFGLNPRKLTNEKALDFFKALIEHGIITKACKIVEISPKTIYDNAARHPRFAEALALAKRIATEKLEEEARRRAVDGVEEPVYYQGEEVGTIRRYSDRLLELLLEANKPGKFGREKRSGGAGTGGEGAGSGGVQVIIQQFGDGGKILAQTVIGGKEDDGGKPAENNSSPQVETPDLSAPSLELP